MDFDKLKHSDTTYAESSALEVLRLNRPRYAFSCAMQSMQSATSVKSQTRLGSWTEQELLCYSQKEGQRPCRGSHKHNPKSRSCMSPKGEPGLSCRMSAESEELAFVSRTGSGWLYLQ